MHDLLLADAEAPTNAQVWSAKGLASWASRYSMSFHVLRPVSRALDWIIAGRVRGHQQCVLSKALKQVICCGMLL